VARLSSSIGFDGLSQINNLVSPDAAHTTCGLHASTHVDLSRTVGDAHAVKVKPLAAVTEYESVTTAFIE
jgi:hypothetical protein